MRRAAPLVLTAAALVAGCGETADRASPPPAPASARPGLLRAPARPGEVIVRADATPATKGPYRLHGRYLVRFEQYAPEDPELDFTAQTPFSAELTPRRDDPRGAVKLVQAAARSGRAELEIHGRKFVSVTFGDFPYVMRFTPRH